MGHLLRSVGHSWQTGTGQLRRDVIRPAAATTGPLHGNVPTASLAVTRKSPLRPTSVPAVDLTKDTFSSASTPGSDPAVVASTTVLDTRPTASLRQSMGQSIDRREAFCAHRCSGNTAFGGLFRLHPTCYSQGQSGHSACYVFDGSAGRGSSASASRHGAAVHGGP